MRQKQYGCRYKNIINVILSLVLFILMVTGCGTREENVNVQQKENDDKIQIGMSFDSFVIERWQRDRDVFVATARDLGAEVNVQTANGEVEEQISQIEYFIDKGADVIVIVPVDADSLSEVIAKAKKADIKVMCYDRVVKNSGADLYVSFDNEKVGDLMGESIYGKIGKSKKVIQICGPETDYNVEQVDNGFLSQTLKNAGHVIGKCHCDGWKSEIAYDYINDNIDLVKKADGIMCGNDDLAGVVVRALSELRMADKIVVVGQDADLEGCQRIVEGTQEMTVYKPVEKLAKTGAEYAVMLAKGQNIKTPTYFNDGKYDIPFVKLEPISVTKDNIDETIISGGYHLEEDVYINVTR